MTFSPKMSQYDGARAKISTADDLLHPPIVCGEFCGESKNILRELGGSGGKYGEAGKNSQFKAIRAKLKSMGNRFTKYFPTLPISTN